MPIVRSGFVKKEKIKNLKWYARKRNAFGLPWTFTVYYFTDDRLFVNAGLFRTVENEVRLYRVLDITLKRNLWQKIFGMGTVVLQTADKSSPIVELKNIRDSRNVKEMLSELVEENRERKRVVNREYMTGGDDYDFDDPDLDL